MGSARWRQRASRPLPEEAEAVTKRKRFGYTSRSAYMPLTEGRQAERTVREPRRRMSASGSELAAAVIFWRKAGRSERMSGVNAGMGSWSVKSTESTVSTISAGVDSVDIVDIVDLGRGTETEMPWSFASWKKVRMVMPWPLALRQRSYCRSVSSWV